MEEAANYVNILDSKFEKVKKSEKSILVSLVDGLLNTNWFHNKSSFNHVFNATFYSDDSIHKHIDQIIEKEVDSGLLLIDGVETRRKLLLEWLRELYYNQLTTAMVRSKDLHNNISYNLTLKISYLLFTVILSNIFQDGIFINLTTFNKFKSSYLNKQLLLVPNHKSHIDYIIIHYLFAKFSIETPLVIAGENLNVPVFGPLLKYLGAVFIKRKFSSDFHYQQNLKNGLLYLTEEKQTIMIELFVEGSRSRNGKSMHPKTGFLNILKNSLGDNVWIQPISFTYEKPYEFDEYLIELNGLDKNQESFGEIFKSGISLLFGKSKLVNYGKLVINFDNELLLLKDLVSSNYGLTGTKIIERIEKISYISGISIIAFSLTIKFYENTNQNIIPKKEIIPIYKEVLNIILLKNKHCDKIIKESLKLTDDQLLKFFDDQITKFLLNHVILKQNAYYIKDEISLVYFKNSLLNLFIDELFHSKYNSTPLNFDILSRVFKFEFSVSLLDQDTNKQTDLNHKLFKNLFNPFLESYELAALNLENIIKVNLKDWLHLLYISYLTKSDTKVKHLRYKESLNKLNLLNALYTFQSLSLISIDKSNDITVKNEAGLRKLKEYLRNVRKHQSINDNLLKEVYLIVTNPTTKEKL